MNLHHSDDPRLWNLSAELRLLGLGGPTMTRREAIRLGLLGSAGLALTGGLASRALGATADGVGFAHLTAREHRQQGRNVVVHLEPVAHVAPVYPELLRLCPTP